MIASDELQWARIKPNEAEPLCVGDLASDDPTDGRVYEILSPGPRIVWAKAARDDEQFIVPASRLRWRARRPVRSSRAAG